jgi:ribonuclease D
MVCGFGEQASYLELVKAITRANIDKSSRFTDWSRRPLSEAQIEYAIADVTHLRDVYVELHKRLKRSNRLDWLVDEMQILSSPATYEQHPMNAWERLRHKIRKPRDLAVLMELAAWREIEAQSRDVPRSRVLKDDILLEVVQSAPRSIDSLGNLRSFPKGMERSRTGADIVAAIERGLARDPAEIPKIERSKRGANAATVELLKVLLRQVSDETGVAAKLIATADDLEAIAADDDTDTQTLKGWRRAIFGEKALKLKAGRLALAVERNKVITLDWQDTEKTSA